MMALAIDAGSCGSDKAAAPPAVSGMALASEVTTGQPHAMASRIVMVQNTVVEIASALIRD